MFSRIYSFFAPQATLSRPEDWVEGVFRKPDNSSSLFLSTRNANFDQYTKDILSTCNLTDLVFDPKGEYCIQDDNFKKLCGESQSRNETIHHDLFASYCDEFERKDLNCISAEMDKFFKLQNWQSKNCRSGPADGISTLLGAVLGSTLGSVFLVISCAYLYKKYQTYKQNREVNPVYHAFHP